MKKPKQQEVTCPHCRGTQSEPQGVISTNCRHCGRYFKIGQKPRQRTLRAPKETREVFCLKCGAPTQVAITAMSTQCSRCLHYQELGDKVVKGVQTGKLNAYDDVIFAAGCSFKGMEATGCHIEVRGKVFSKLRAREEIIVVAGGQASGEFHAPLIQVEAGAKVKVMTVECDKLEVSGDLEVSGALLAKEIVLREGANFVGKLQMPHGKLRVERGAKTQFDALLCEEVIVGGSLYLPGSVEAKRVSVEPGGELSARRISAGRIEVSPGGFLQGKIERYVSDDHDVPQAA